MSNFLKKYKVALIISTAGLALTIFLVSKKNNISPLPTPTKTILRLESFYPPEGPQQLGFPSSAIAFYFTTQIDKSNTLINISPVTDYKFDTDGTGKILYLKPATVWKFNTNYTINLTVKSTDGQQLGPIKYTFKPTSPKGSDLTE